MIGMVMLNWMLWTSRPVPRRLSGWGLVTAVVLVALSVAALLIAAPDALAIVLIAPLALQEMVLAVWMIVKGVDREALARLG